MSKATIHAAVLAELERQREAFAISDPLEESEFDVCDIDWEAIGVAAVEALREPSGELLDAIRGCSTVHDWRGMIDTILGEYERDPYNSLPDSPSDG